MLCEEAKALLEATGLSERSFAVELLIREFANNAVIHGNGQDSGKRVRLSLRIGMKRMVLTIADEGRGFDWRSRYLLEAGDSATSGRGLSIGRQYAERLRYNRRGNRVTLWIGK